MATPRHDLNLEVAGLLYDLALVHPSPHGRIAYKRAAQTVMALDRTVDALVAEGALRAVPHIGPATERVVREALDAGTSPTVERAIEKSGKRANVAAAHAHRRHFLSRAEALRILEAPVRPRAVGRADYQGDLQMHSSWSDGGEGIAALAAAARARGYRYIGVSDHSYGLKIAGGMSMENAARQRREIERLNRGWRGDFRVIQGVEANIPVAGGVDLEPEELAAFELVLAAPHSALRRAEDQTPRMLATVRHPGVHILAHPRGRMYSRQGVLAQWDEVFVEAARHGVAIELDGDPYRQDLDHTLASRALAAGCIFALDSDAHGGDELEYSEIALAHARLAKIPAERVINTWSADRLLAWAADRPTRSVAPSARTSAARSVARKSAAGSVARKSEAGSAGNP